MRRVRIASTGLRAAPVALALFLSGAAIAQQAPTPAPTAAPTEEAKPAAVTVKPAAASADKPADKPAAKPAAPTGPTITAGDFTVKFGILFQPQAEWLQDTTTGGYQQNFFLRRARINLSGNLGKNVAYFIQTENSRLGYATGTATGGATANKTISTGLQMQDAVVEWRLQKEFNLWAGLIYLPTSREALKGSATEFALDQSTWAYTATGALQGTGGRDTGFMARGYFVKDRLEYRIGAFQGFRQAGSRNSFRTIARLQYNFFDVETYNLPAYSGAYLGTKKVLAIGAAYDTQSDYKGYTADVYVDIPTPFGAVEGTATYQLLDGGVFLPAALPKSTIFQIEACAYLKNSKVGPWARYEQRDFTAASQRDEKRVLVGVNYYVKGHNFNAKAAFGKVDYSPAFPSGRDSASQFALQLQVYY